MLCCVWNLPESHSWSKIRFQLYCSEKFYWCLLPELRLARWGRGVSFLVWLWLEISALHRLCQGAIYVLAGCGLVWYQELLGGSKGPSLPRSQMFKFKIIYLRRLATGQAGDHGTLHPGAISAVWEIFCSESSQTRKMFLSCRNIKRILIWYLVKYKISVWFLCVCRFGHIFWHNLDRGDWK